MPIRLTKTVKAILTLSFVTFLVQQTADRFFGTHLMFWLGLVPDGFFSGHRYWQLLTYALLHQDVMHLFFDLLMIAFIGAELEAIWGARRFIRYVLFCSMSSGLIYLLLQALWVKGTGMYQPMIGASGAIFGLLVAYGLVFGNRILLFMMLFPLKAKHFIWVLALIELMATFYSTGGGIANLAHLGGMAAGFFYLWARVYRKTSFLVNLPALFQSFRRTRKKRSSHLKLVVDNDKQFEGGIDPSDDDHSQDKPKTWH